jgi:type III pantothenate kinase
MRLDRVNDKIWIALAIGNSRYHWAWFLNTKLQSSWDTSYLTVDALDRIMSVSNNIIDRVSFDLKDGLGLLPSNLLQSISDRQITISQIPIYLCSVVSSQTEIWQQFPQVKPIALTDIPLLDLYPTLGIDRALAVLGAGENYGYPILVIDGGTALTITGVDRDRSLIGGAIMPGLKLQLQSLSIGTSALPAIELPLQLPARWSNNTEGAIASGILHTLSSGISDFIHDWERLFPESKMIFTGGDGELLAKYLQSILPIHLADRVGFDRDLLFSGILATIDSQQL